jgi:hypothetical protein
MFDAEATGAALARFAEIDAAASDAPAANAAWRAARRLGETWGEGSVEGVAVLLAPEFRCSDRRLLVQSELDREGFLASFRPHLEQPGVHGGENELLATRGERLALVRVLVRFDPPPDADVGPHEVENLQVVEIDAAGRIVCFVMFDPTARDTADAELEARHAAIDRATADPLAK